MPLSHEVSKIHEGVNFKNIILVILDVDSNYF
jgi:hypothetical protein